MATKDSFDAFVNIVRDKIDEFSENIDPPKIEIIQNELKEKFNNLAESQGYVSSEEYEALKILAKRLEERVSKLEDLLSKSEAN
jgi:glycerophosphoryl diester phosphodiesterase